MSTTSKILLAIVGIVITGFLASNFMIQQAAPLGVATNAGIYASSTNSSVSCLSTSTTLLAAGPARQFFSVSNTSSTQTVYVCKGSSCTTGTGIALSGVATYYQRSDDGYTGAYSCVSGATTSVSISYKQ